MSGNTTGNYNTGIGTAALTGNVTGEYNLAIGHYALKTSQTGNYNVALGYYALYSSNGASNNVAIGYQASQKSTSGHNNIAIGYFARYKATTSTNSVAIGMAAMQEGNEPYSLAIGNNALYNSASINGGNVAVGMSALQGNTTGEGNVAIGSGTLQSKTTGNQNVAIGYNAGAMSAGGELIRNVLIGYNAGSQLAGNGNYNTVIGAASGTTVTTGSTNIIIGYNCQTPAADSVSKINIGNTIYGDIGSTKQQIGVGVAAPTAHMHLKAGAAGAGLSSLKIDAGTLLTTPEAGSIEFDGTNLYFTDSTGTRRTLAVAA